jgi:hypothetical protein
MKVIEGLGRKSKKMNRDEGDKGDGKKEQRKIKASQV